MKKTLLVFVLLFSWQSFAQLQDFEFYMEKSCSEMTDENSQDAFIRFVAKEIKNDLGKNFCDKVISSEQDYLEMTMESEQSFSTIVGPAEYSKLIDSLYQYYESLH
ncbi:hypothetical protein [Halobacteriovorax sp. HLS]|uniref:hypothetical protein n=1 Tax=Halobacteriovorax sp. HLS TaxID=2234000 RepID=UPI000FD90526|nr:hypothetical protein [Halobacteriovorax sp. HLS]